jgi:hypothetical protein
MVRQSESFRVVLCKNSVSRGSALLKPALFGTRQSRPQRLYKSIQTRRGCVSFDPIRFHRSSAAIGPKPPLSPCSQSLRFLECAIETYIHVY